MSLLSNLLGGDSGGGSAYFPSSITPSLSNIGTSTGAYADWFNSISVVADNTFQVAFTSSQKGIIQALSIYNNGNTTAVFDVKVTLDGTVFNLSETLNGYASSSVFMSIFGVWGSNSNSTPSIDLLGLESIPFETDMKVEIKAPIASGTYKMAIKYVEVD